MIRVMIVDDSATSRQLLRHVVDAAPDMQVVCELADGQQAIQKVRKVRPDVILMDIVMPDVDGMAATGEIMATQPTPIVMISGTLQGRETEMAFQAIKRGALTLLPKPDGPGDPTFPAQAERLVSTLRAMAGVRVIHHLSGRKKPDGTRSSNMALQQTLSAAPEIVGIASSTGGPAALAEIVQQLPITFPLPIVIVQHIAADFLKSLAEWLSHVSPLRVQLATAGEMPVAGQIYLAPPGKHLVLDKNRSFDQKSLPPGPHVPSGDMLLSSLAREYGPAAIGVILTGMGTDGARGLWEMRQQGAVTIGQSEKTCAVYGMPAEADRLGATQYSLSLNMIASMLKDLSEREPHA